MFLSILVVIFISSIGNRECLAFSSMVRTTTKSVKRILPPSSSRRSTTLLFVALENSDNAGSNGIDDKEDPDSDINGNEWKAGNVKEDFELLRIAYVKSSAKDDLLMKERQSILSYLSFKKNEQLFSLARMSKLLSVFVWTSFLMNFSVRNTCPTGMQRMLAKFGGLIIHAMNIHYYVFVLAFPVVAYVMTMMEEQNLPKLTKILRQRKKTLFGGSNILSSKISKSRRSSWMNSPSSSTKVASKIPTTALMDVKYSAIWILELWMSCILSPLIFHTLSIGMNIQRSFQFNLILRYTIIIQLITRISASMSLYQYPKLMYEIQQKQKEFHLLPQTRTMYVIQTGMDIMMKFLFLGISSDLARLFFRISSESLYPKVSIRSMKFSFCTAFSLLVILFGPLCHIFAFSRIVQIKQSVEIPSLSNDYNTFRQLSEMKTTEKKWRMNLKWRIPERINQTISKWYYLFMAGYASKKDRQHKKFYSQFADWLVLPTDTRKKYKNEILNLEADRLFKDDINSNIEENETKEKRRKIIAQGRQTDRAVWVTSAMASMSNQHEVDFENEQFDDYLGVALQKTLGVGLSFAYDHETPSKQLSIHRLRARAAKSAIHHIRQLYANAAKDSSYSNQSEAEQMIQQEIDYYTNKLIEYTPTNYGNDEYNDGVLTLPDGFYDDQMQIISESDLGLNMSDLKRDNMITSIGDTPDYTEETLRQQYGHDFVNDPWVQKGIHKADITFDEFVKMRKEEKNRKEQEQLDREDEDYVDLWLNQYFEERNISPMNQNKGADDNNENSYSTKSDDEDTAMYLA